MGLIRTKMPGRSAVTDDGIWRSAWVTNGTAFFTKAADRVSYVVIGTVRPKHRGCHLSAIQQLQSFANASGRPITRPFMTSISAARSSAKDIIAARGPKAAGG